MATTFNDANAWVNGQGNVSLGAAGFDDASGDPAALYSKGDVFINIPLNTLVDSALTQAATFARTSAGLYTLAIATNGTSIIVVPITGFFRKFAGLAKGPANPHGFKVLDMVLGYTVGTLALTSMAVAFFTEVQTNNGARASVATPLGAVTYENPIGTVAATLPVATQANPYQSRAVPALPVFINADNTELFAEITTVIPNTSIVTFTHIGFHLSVALY